MCVEKREEDFEGEVHVFTLPMVLGSAGTTLAKDSGTLGVFLKLFSTKTLTWETMKQLMEVLAEIYTSSGFWEVCHPNKGADQ